MSKATHLSSAFQVFVIIDHHHHHDIYGDNDKICDVFDNIYVNIDNADGIDNDKAIMVVKIMKVVVIILVKLITLSLKLRVKELRVKFKS